MIRNHKCKCGNTVLVTGRQGPPTCKVCPDCGTTLSRYGNPPPRQTAHVVYPVKNGITQEVDHYICRNCNTRLERSEVEVSEENSE